MFERLALADFGNRIPQLSFEVVRVVDDFARSVRGVVLIPGSGEFVYATVPVTRNGPNGTRVPENVHTRLAATNFGAALDQLETELPNASSVSLVVSWFGSDLRAGHCTIQPAVEITDKSTAPLSWSVAGLTRATAAVVSQYDEGPAYGGTPSDSTVISAILDLKARGLSVTLNPFLLMDIGPGNVLADPYSEADSQPLYPWRGRITVDPAAGRPGSPDKTAAAASQIASFVGTAAPGDFTVVPPPAPPNPGSLLGGLVAAALPTSPTVAYSGPAEWSYRRFILHHAALALAAGGVDAFVIGSELRGLSTVRSGPGTYPFVAALTALAADVKAMLGPATKVTYAADWSEYFGHQPTDGSGDVYFHLDPLWSSSAIDAIGIDLYWPLADWRDGDSHLDAALAATPHDLAYLKANLASGEGYDWYYASPADRAAQVRTPITDGLGKPWVFRFKDLRAWWESPHFDRPGGIEAATPTAWVPQSKPFWLMEIGAPAVDKGANQPNVFVDPKSSESALPHFSSGRRDDLAQRRVIQAIVEAFDPDHAGAVPALNPTSTIYHGPMVDPARTHVYAWDARPHPAFPADTETWGDADNWRLGHWLNGRTAAMPLADVIATLVADFGLSDVDPSALDGLVPGFVVDRIMSAREALQPLELAYFFDAVETGGGIRFVPRGRAASALALTDDDLVEARPEAPLHALVRGQETDLPASAKLTFIEASGDYRQAVAEARRQTGASLRVARAELPLMLDAEQAEAIVQSWLYETWAGRERATFTLPPSRLALEPGDAVTLATGGFSRPFRIVETGDHGARDIEARAIDREVYRLRLGAGRAPSVGRALVVGPGDAAFLDLPLLRGDEPETSGYVAVSQSPWPGAFALYASPDNTGFALAGYATAPATMGVTTSDLVPGPTSRFDYSAVLHVRLDRGSLRSATRLALLSGTNAAALVAPDGAIEIIQFETATLTAPSSYALTGLLRGQAGSEHAMAPLLGAGARFVMLDPALARIDLAPDRIGLPLTWRYGPARRNLGHDSYATTTHAFLGIGRRPLSPVHVRASRAANGDVAIGWIRRTRIGGDSWDVEEVPLGETSESYDIDILDGAALKRTLSSAVPSVLYSAAAQTADFGSLPATIDIAIAQRSSTFGRGIAARATV